MTNSTVARPRVMIVDDDEYLLGLVREMMNVLPVEPLTACGGAEALAQLETGPPVDLLLCDLRMPGMDGIEFIRHLAMRRFAGALALLSGEDAGILDTARRLAGAHGLRVVGALSKPVTPEAIAGLVARLDIRPPAAGTQPQRFGPEDLARGIAADELVVHYQPRVELSGGFVTGVEALVRWQHPEHGLVYPGDFVPLAESAGLMQALTGAVLDRTLSQMAVWQGEGLLLKVGVNASISTLADVSFPDVLAALAREKGVAVTGIVVEITESELLDRLDLTLDTLIRLRLKGVDLSIDDFGTGFASLEQLRQIPFTELKIDRQFVHGAHADPKLAAILGSSLDLAARLQLSTVGEGVEDPSDWALLQQLGCREAQGYAIARPMPADRLADWIAGWPGDPRPPADSA
jgi:EAL domain-containing protein (putative c-di-GMP-specific phosphodiesterase class I)